LSELVLVAADAPFTHRDRAAAPLDERHAQVKGEAVEQAHAPHPVRLVLERRLRWVLVATARGRQS
jgi:hypothetical protein